MFPGRSEHYNAEGTFSEYSENIMGWLENSTSCIFKSWFEINICGNVVEL